MLIDTSKLNITKTYVCSEISDSFIGKTIRNLQQKVYPNINYDNIPSHTFALVYNESLVKWLVYENHAKWGGIKAYPVSEYEKDNTSSVKKVILNEDSLDLCAATYWLRNNPGYSVLNLAEITEERLLKGIKLPDTKGWVCSETIAYLNLDICLKLNLPVSEIAPVDWIRYFNV
jgi:hypothetical protein